MFESSSIQHSLMERNSDLSKLETVNSTPEKRQYILQKTIDYYRFHLIPSGEIKSYKKNRQIIQCLSLYIIQFKY